MHQGSTEGDWRRGTPTVVRVVSHSAVWAAVLVPMIVLLAHGWIALGDFGSISIRAYQTLQLPPPLVGMLSTAGTVGHNIFDPGPLLFWLLAIPVRIDPAKGAFWGAAVLGGAVMSMAIEAVWSTRQWLGCALIGFCALDLLWLVPQVFETLLWNAYFPIPFLIATVALAWVVGRGAFGWWPVLVGVASIAAQTHLIFAMPCVALAVVAPVMALKFAGRPERFRWLVVGLVVGVACWLAPLLQNFDAQGNLTAILRGSGGKTEGVAFGLRIVAMTGAPSPLWLKQAPTNYFSAVGFINANRPLTGFIVLVLLVIIALAAWRKHHRSLSALAVMALVCSVSFAISFTIFPQKNSISLSYLIYGLWAVSVLLWTVVVWGIALLVPVVVHRFTRAEPSESSRDGLARRRVVAAGAAAVVAVLLVAFAAIWPFRDISQTDPIYANERALYAAVRQTAKGIEHTVPPGPVVFAFHSQDGKGFPAYSSFLITEGVAWQLEADGWRPGLFGFVAIYTGLTPSVRAASVIVTFRGLRPVSFTRKPCTWVMPGCLSPKAKPPASTIGSTPPGGAAAAG
jgi:hypothetical protein